MKYFSLFSGIGGFEYGIQQAWEDNNSWRHGEQRPHKQMDLQRPGNKSDFDGGGKSQQSNQYTSRYKKNICVGFSEIDQYAIQIYKKHFSNHKEYGNVTNIKWSDVGDFEMLVGGFPCQSFSIAGKRRGFNDIRGTLFFEIARATQEKQPRFLLLENVKGLLSHDKGRTFGTILNTLDELGYDLQWQVLNSKNFGVPQNRERVFIIGHLRTTSRPQVFPLLRSNSNPVPRNQETKKQLANTITGKYGTGNARGTHIRTDIQSTQSRGNKPNNPNSIRRATYSDDMRIRRLTPTECERLQGFPDGWTEGISDTQRYKCLGNAVTTNVISAIMEKLLDSLRRKC